MMYYYEIKQDLMKRNLIVKEDMYLLEGKLLFTNENAFIKVYDYFKNKNIDMITGTPRNYPHWSQEFTDYIYFEGL